MSMRTLWAFFAMAFGITWGIGALAVLFPDFVAAVFGEISLTNPLFIVAVYGPAIATFILVTLHGGLAGVGRFLSRLTYWRCSAGWWAFVLVGIPALMYGAAAVNGTLDEPFPFDPWYGAIAALAITLVIGPVEEFGWRGLALPLLQRRYSPFTSALIVGAVWGIWHLPAFLLSGTPQSSFAILPFLIAVLPVSVIMTALFNASRGSILMVALMHAQLNNPIFPDAQPWDTAAFALAAVVVLWLYRDRMFAMTGETTVIPGEEQPNKSD